MNYERANKVGKEMVRGSIVLGIMFFLAAMYMIWFGGAI